MPLNFSPKSISQRKLKNKTKIQQCQNFRLVVVEIRREYMNYNGNFELDLHHSRKS